MSLFKKMKLIPFNETNEEEIMKGEGNEKIEKHQNDLSIETRIANLVRSNLDEQTKIEIIKSLIKSPEINKQKQLVIGRKLMTPPSKKKRQQIKDNLEQNEMLKNIKWNQF